MHNAGQPGPHRGRQLHLGSRERRVLVVGHQHARAAAGEPPGAAHQPDGAQDRAPRVPRLLGQQADLGRLLLRKVHQPMELCRRHGVVKERERERETERERGRGAEEEKEEEESLRTINRGRETGLKWTLAWNGHWHGDWPTGVNMSCPMLTCLVVAAASATRYLVISL